MSIKKIIYLFYCSPWLFNSTYWMVVTTCSVFKKYFCSVLHNVYIMYTLHLKSQQETKKIDLCILYLKTTLVIHLEYEMVSCISGTLFLISYTFVYWEKIGREKIFLKIFVSSNTFCFVHDYPTPIVHVWVKKSQRVQNSLFSISLCLFVINNNKKKNSLDLYHHHLSTLLFFSEIFF